MIRVKIQDANQAISFLAEQATVLRLIAGCSINPNSIDELLIATDIYQRGFAAALMADLMEFDKALHRRGASFIHQAITPARQTEQPLMTTFQIIDEFTAEESRQPRGDSLVMINLVGRTIRTSQNFEIPRRSEVSIQIGGTETDRLVSYVLPADWEVEPIKKNV